jgi:two-component system heavy metal sensor histidine kinase CusS
MWSKIVVEGVRSPFRWRGSLALRLAAWYALSAFALIFVSTAVLYQVLEANEAREDADFLAQNLDNVSLLLAGGDPRPKLPANRQLYLRVMDAQGRTIVETPGMARELPPPAPEAEPKGAPVAKVKTDVVSKTGRSFQTITAWSPARPDHPARRVQIALDRAGEERLVATYRRRAWLILAASLVGCALLGALVARLGLRPIRRIGEAAGRIGQTTLHERIATDGLPSDLLGLADSFNTMLDRLQEAFSRTSRFSDNVAHELRTPIGNLRGEIEVALSKPRAGEDYRETLGSCLEECGRISRMVERLLFLARTDAAVEPLARETVEVRRELAAVHEFYDAAAADAGVALEFDAPADLTAQLDRVLFQQALGNLIANAIAHTPAGGSIWIRALNVNGSLGVSVEDTGVGVSPEHIARVFERFYRVDPSRSGANAGLGLAVVKAIVERHGGRAELRSRTGAGTTVDLVFPGAAAS